jgi:predicted metalloprotease with PDZ domain
MNRLRLFKLRRLGVGLAALFALAQSAAATDARTARYRVRMLQAAPPKLAVTATLPIDGRTLEMGTTRPVMPELDALGWPALIGNLRVSDAQGRPLPVTRSGPKGWLLDQPHSGPLKVEYEVDYSPLAARAWPAPREAAFADAGHVVVIGRSLFLTTPNAGSSDVTFDLPAGWLPVVPWERRKGAEQAFDAGSSEDLTENFVVLSRSQPDKVTAGGFTLLVTTLGHWEPARPEVRRVLGGVIPRLVGLMGSDEKVSYSVVLLPTLERGGEAFRRSFAMTIDEPPSRVNSAVWGNTIAHEVFHYWNGWGLRGADYAASQWFQEGFTEYAANLSMVNAGLITPDELRKKLADHIGNARKLTTSPEAGGSRKGPPLYSAGALTAFSWDVMIRDSTGGKRNLGDFLRALWSQTERGRRPYEWRDLQAALEATAPLDWNAFYNAHIRGNQPLPLAEILPRAGLRLGRAEDGSPRVEIDSAAPAPAKALWQALVEGR